MKKVCSTGDSNVVTHHSTNPAHTCLISEFGWDRVFSHGYDRRQSRWWSLSQKKKKLLKEELQNAKQAGVVNLSSRSSQAL